MRYLSRTLSVLAMLTAGTMSAAAQTQGVTDDTIVLGTYTDLSGPLAVWGVPAERGMRMRVDEINAAGGIHGRKIVYIVEDTQYQLPRAMQAANKLLRRDKIFAMVGPLGTPENLAIMPEQLASGVPNMFPLSGAIEMVEPFHPLKFAYWRSYTDQFRAGVAYFHENGGFKTPCVAQAANEAGESMTLGVDQQLAKYDMKIAARTEHSPTETDFVSSVTTLKNAGCDIVFLASGVRDAILIVATSKKLGFEPIFVTSNVPYMDAVAEAADGAMEGLYAVSPYVFADPATAEGRSKEILDAYSAKYGEKMPPQAQQGYVFMDLVRIALEAAGRDVTSEKFAAATEAITDYIDPIGGQKISFSPTDHEGIETLILAKVEGKAWKTIARGLDF